MNAEPGTHLPPTKRRPKVLLIDDRNSKATGLRSALLQYGLDAVQATDAAEALARIDCWSPDLIVLEVRVPGIDGHSLFEVLSGSSAIPILILSVETHEPGLVHYLEAGAIGYLTKLSSVVELGARVRACLRAFGRAGFSPQRIKHPVLDEPVSANAEHANSAQQVKRSLTMGRHRVFEQDIESG